MYNFVMFQFYLILIPFFHNSNCIFKNLKLCFELFVKSFFISDVNGFIQFGLFRYI